MVESDQSADRFSRLGRCAIASTRGDPNNVDLAAVTAAGVPVLNTPGRNADAVAEMTLALLSLTRQVLAADADVRAGEISATAPSLSALRAWELAGRTAGLVGLGAVGQATKWRLRAGAEGDRLRPVHAEAKHSLDELLAEADIVSMHAPVTGKPPG